jgi:hypothetical protein
MSDETTRYAVIREPDGRGVVIDKQSNWVDRCVFGPASIAACRRKAKQLNQKS